METDSATTSANSSGGEYRVKGRPVVHSIIHSNTHFHLFGLLVFPCCREIRVGHFLFWVSVSWSSGGTNSRFLESSAFRFFALWPLFKLLPSIGPRVHREIWHSAHSRSRPISTGPQLRTLRGMPLSLLISWGAQICWCNPSTASLRSR